MPKTIQLKVSVLERWKSWLAYLKSYTYSSFPLSSESYELRRQIQKIWYDIEATRAKGDLP